MWDNYLNAIEWYHKSYQRDKQLEKLLDFVFSGSALEVTSIAKKQAKSVCSQRLNEDAAGTKGKRCWCFFCSRNLKMISKFAE